MSTFSSYRRDIDGLRAIAVLAVTLYHFDFQWLPGGYVGVDVFFVISGYLITGKLLREIQDHGRVDFGAFYEARIRRLLPALLTTVCATAFVGTWLLSPSDLSDLGQSVLASIVGFANLFFWMQSGYFDTSTLRKPLLHMWSLGVEEQFYLFWPAALLLLSSLGPTKRLISLSAMFFGSLLLCVFVMRGFPGMPILTDAFADGASIAFYLTPFRVFEFIAGAAICLVPQMRARWQSEATSAVGIAMIVVAILAFNHDTPFPSYNALLPSLGAALVIYGGRQSVSGSILKMKPLVWIGLISYSVYLVHWPLVTFYRFGRVTSLTEMDKALLVITTLALATAMYVLVEKPFRTRGHRLYFNRRQLFRGAALGVASATLFMAGSAGGMTWRIPGYDSMVSLASAYGGDDCLFPSCEAGSAGEDILVIGDSFGRQLHAGLIAEFPEQRFTFRDQRTCSTWSLQWIRHDPGTDPTSCISERQILFDHLEAGRPVILANHWGWSDLIDAKELAAGRVVERKIESADSTRFAAGELRKIADHFDAPILIVANPPDVTPLGSLEQCIYSSRAGACDSVVLSEINVRRQFAREAAELGLAVVDPYDALCDVDVCRTYDDRGLYFSDAYHLSRLGSQVVVKNLRAEFSSFLALANAAGEN